MQSAARRSPTSLGAPRRLALAVFGVFGFAAQGSAQQDVIDTFAGGGPSGMRALNANLYYPDNAAVDAAGNLYVTSLVQNQVFKIARDGTLVLIAGDGFAGFSGDGGLAVAARLNDPEGIAVDEAQPVNVYIADTQNCVVRRVDGATGRIATIAGYVPTSATGNRVPLCGFSGDGGRAGSAQLNTPYGLAVNPLNSDLYIADGANGRIRKVARGAAGGIISTIAGGAGSSTLENNCLGTAPYGDGGPAVDASLCYPRAVALDTTADPVNVFISDGGLGQYCTLREVVGKSGAIHAIAGDYSCGFVDDVTATRAELDGVEQLHVAVSGLETTITAADYHNLRVRQFSLTYAADIPLAGTIATIVGSGAYGFCGDGGPAPAACLTNPAGLAYDAHGGFYISDLANNRIRRVTPDGDKIETIAGWGQGLYSAPVALGRVPGTGLSLAAPSVVFVDPASHRIYVGGNSTPVIYVIDPATNTASTFAGDGLAGFSGDGAAADAPGTELSSPQGVAADKAGNVFIADAANCAIREVLHTTGTITTIAGGSKGTLNGCGYAGDGGPAGSAKLSSPRGLAIGGDDVLYVADHDNCVVRRIVLATGIIDTFAGNSFCGYGGDGSAATAASLSGPSALAVDGHDNLFIADQANNRIRRVGSSGIIATIAGNGVAAYSGDGAAADNSLDHPAGIAIDVNDNLFVTDQDNQLVRWIDPAGWMLTFAGLPHAVGAFSGDGGAATSAMLHAPQGIAVDDFGTHYVADTENNRIRRVTAFSGFGRSAAVLSFPGQRVGTKSRHESITLSAIGPLSISNITISEGFVETDNCVGRSMNAGNRCTIDVYFEPAKVGPLKGVLKIDSNAHFSKQANSVSLTGDATR